MAKVLVIEGNEVRPLAQTKFTEESKLQDYLEGYPSLIPLGEIVEGASDLLCIGREVSVPPGSIDFLFIDEKGLLTVVETKLAKNPEARRTVIGQIIEYASYMAEWSADDVYRIADDYFSKSDKVPSDYRGCTLNESMEKFSGSGLIAEDLTNNVEQNLRNGKVRLLIAVDEMVEPLRATVTFLNRNSNFDILLLQVKSFEESTSRKVLIPSLFGYAQKPGSTVLKRKINEEIFLTRCREGEHKGAEKLYYEAKALQQSRRANGDFINWGVSGYSYWMFWKGNPAGEVIFVSSANGNLSLWLYIIEKGAEAAERYLENLNNIADFGRKVGDYKNHKEPSFSTDRMTAADIDSFMSALRELGLALEAEAGK